MNTNTEIFQAMTGYEIDALIIWFDSLIPEDQAIGVFRIIAETRYGTIDIWVN